MGVHWAILKQDFEWKSFSRVSSSWTWWLAPTGMQNADRGVCNASWPATQKCS